MPAGAIASPRLVPHSHATKAMFNSPGLSLALQTSVEGQGEVARTGENYDSSTVGGRRSRDEEHESRSGSENMDGTASGDDVDAAENPSRKKRYHRHTPQQIQELETYWR